MTNKTAFVTGASSGIGSAIVAALKSNGWEVIGPSHSELDLNDLQAVETYGHELQKKVETIDAFVHVAGIWHDSQGPLADKKLANFTAGQITTTMHVGLVAPMLLLAALLPVIKNGTVVGISGTFESGGAGWLPYYTSKRAVEDFLVGLSQDYPELKVYGVSPADTATPAYRKFYPQYIDESQTPEVVANLVTKLLQGNSEFKSGDIIELRQGSAKTGFHV